MEEKGLNVIFGSNRVTVQKNNKTIVEGCLSGGLYVINFKVRLEEINIVQVVDAEIWHRRMGHSSTFPSRIECDVCYRGKQTRERFHETPEFKKPRRILEVVSSDVAGPFVPETFDGMRYYVSFIDHYSHFVQIYLMKTKDEVIKKFKQYEAQVTAKFGMKISRFRCDNGGEYVSHEFKNFCKEKGILIEYNIPRNPEQNGVSERFNRTLLNMVRCLLLDSNMDKTFWGEAARTATYILNRCKTKALKDGKCPAEVWYGYKINLENIRRFGCKTYVHIPKEVRHGKLDERAQVMVMMGYTQNGYRLWDTINKIIITARNVKFCENQGILENITEIIPDDSNTNDDKNEKKNEENEGVNNKIEETENENEDIVKDVRRSMRIRKMPEEFKDYEVEDVMLALSTGNLPGETPNTYEEAVQNGWKSAIENELMSLKRNGTWDLVPRPVNVHTVDSKWIFRSKVVKGEVIKKARLVARGFKQHEVMDDVYSPVARMTTLRMLLSVSIEQQWYIHQLDVKSAFLKSELKEPVYLEPPEGFKCPENYVCKLNKALYGLRQSPKSWNDSLNNCLTGIKFCRSKIDPCLYFKNCTYILI